MWQTFSWVSIQVNGAADIDYWKILSRWPSTFTGSHFNIQIHTAVDFEAQRYDSFSRVVIAGGLFIPPCGLCWLPRGVVYTMCTPHIYHLCLSSLHSVDNYLLWYSLQYETRMKSRHILQKDINQMLLSVLPTSVSSSTPYFSVHLQYLPVYHIHCNYHNYHTQPYHTPLTSSEYLFTVQIIMFVLWSLYHTRHARQLSLAKSENAALARSRYTLVVRVIPGIYHLCHRWKRKYICVTVNLYFSFLRQLCLQIQMNILLLSLARGFWLFQF